MHVQKFQPFQNVRLAQWVRVAGFWGGKRPSPCWRNTIRSAPSNTISTGDAGGPGRDDWTVFSSNTLLYDLLFYKDLMYYETGCGNPVDIFGVYREVIGLGAV